MKPIFRSIKYFTKSAEVYYLVLIGMSIVFALFHSLGNEPGTSMEATFYSMPYHLLIYTIIVLIATGIVISVQLFPLIMSYNCTRKNLVIALHWMLLLLGIQIIATMVIFCYIFKHDITNDFMKLFPVWTGVILFCIGISLLFGGLSIRFGKSAIWLIGISATLFGTCFGFMSSAAEDNSFIFSKLSTLAIFKSLNLNVWALVIGGATYLISTIANYLMVRKAAVKI